MPTDMQTLATVRHVARKSPEDAAIEARVRAHVRRRMEELCIGVTKAAEMTGIGQGSLTNILQNSRGMGLGVAMRLISGLHMDPGTVLMVPPEERFFRAYVPRAPDEDPPRPVRRRPPPK